ncbi:MAG: hypothetical protein IJB96_09245 [Lachnospira sp.]|nr:hypothetical protein [Lachnospira sp.]
MIKVQLRTFDEYFDIVRSKERLYKYNEDCFSLIVDKWIKKNETCPPFRDEYSQSFLKDVFDITFVENDWYSVIYQGRRRCIFDMGDYVKFGLVAIAASREGAYVGYFSSYKEYYQIPKKVWEYLGNLPFDILIAINMDALDEFCTLGIFGEQDVLLLNYPFDGKRIEVHMSEHIDKEHYVKVMDSVGRTLYKGEDNQYYTKEEQMVNDVSFDWKREVSAVIDWMKYETKYVYDTAYFYKHTQVMNIAEFIRLIGFEKYDRIEGDFSIVNHLTEEPHGGYHDDIVMMIVRKNKDGTYWVGDEVPWKIRGFIDYLWALDEMRSSDCESYVLVVDVAYRVCSVNDLKYVIYGFKVSSDNIEIFDKYYGVKMFCEVLGEAYESDRCEIVY